MPEASEHVVVDEEDRVAKILSIAPFDQWTYEDAYQALKDLLPSNYDRTELYVRGEHYQQGKEWVGPGDPAVNKTIEKQFAPDNAIGEVLTNIENAFLEPQVGSTPLEETTVLNAEATARQRELNAILAEWWDKQRLQELIQDRLRTSAWAGWAGLRVWVPWRHIIEQGDGTLTIREASDVRQALSYLHVMAPVPHCGAIITDGSTQDKIAVYLSTEVEYRDGKKFEYPNAELVYLDPERANDAEAATIIRIVYSNNEKPASRAAIPMRGNLLFAEMRTSVVINEPVLRSQRQLNFVTTLLTRIAETAAFRERYTKNAKPQGIRIPYNDGDKLATGAFLERDDEGRQWQVVPQARTLGAATTTELVGLPRFNDKGDQVGFETPDVFIVDPVDPAPWINAADSVRRRILRMCGQGHLGGMSNAEASGIAYEQARAVFEKDLNKRRVSEEGMLREFLTSVVMLAEYIAGTPGFYTESLRPTVDQSVNPGPRSPDLVRLDLEGYEHGILAEETVMSRFNIEDPEAERLRISRSTGHILKVLEKISGSGQIYEPESLKEFMIELGIPRDIVDKLEPKPEPEPVQPTPPATPPAN